MKPLHRIWTYFFPNPSFYGWAVVGVCFWCSLLSSPGQSFVISLYIEHAMAAAGLSRLEISSLYAAMTLSAAACLPMMGRLADRWPSRRFLGVVVVLLGASCALFASVQNAVMLGAAFFLLRLLGQGSIGLGTLTVTVQWFRRYRGRALAVVGQGYAAGEMVFPAIVFALMTLLGWRGSLWLFAGLYILMFAPLVAFLLRERRLDEWSDGVKASIDQPIAEVYEAEERAFSLAEAMRMPAFWVMVACVSVFPMAVTALIFHQVAIFESMQWGAARIPLSFATFAGAALLMTYVSGMVLERVSSRFAISLAMVFMVLAMASTFVALPALAASLAYGSLLGVASGMTASANNMLWPEYYGIAALGAIKGVVTAVRNGATALGPPLVALLAGEAERFGTAFVVLGSICALTAIVALLIKPPAAPAQA
ncbi:MAG: MFS transporter [Bradymonadaceae bacterium]|nr:MFS transporter [Lujinxingiaceae bacterium]